MFDDRLPLCRLGEGVHWDERSGAVYWVDILGKTVHRYAIADHHHQSWTVSKEVSFVFPQPDDHLLLGLCDGIYDFDPVTGSEVPVATLALPHDHRLNDGKMDPRGRLWVGTINTAPEPSMTAALYELRDGRLEEVEGGYANANGKAWSPDGRFMYHADTARSTIWIYDFELETGTPSNKRVFAKTSDGDPDGLCSDNQGRLYAAMFGGSRVDVYSERGDVVDVIEVPAPNVTSCAIGGADQGTRFITTAFDGMDAAQRSAAPLSGQTFVVPLSLD
jgi:xylono-1,5-lactonase